MPWWLISPGGRQVRRFGKATPIEQLTAMVQGYLEPIREQDSLKMYLDAYHKITAQPNNGVAASPTKPSRP